MKMTGVRKLSYDPKNIIGGGSFGTEFIGFYFLSESSKPMPVTVKRVLRSQLIGDESVIQKEVELITKASNHPNFLRVIHTEMNEDFL